MQRTAIVMRCRLVTKSERFCMDVTCGYATYITLGAIPVLLLLCYPFSDCSGCISGYVRGFCSTGLRAV